MASTRSTSGKLVLGDPTGFKPATPFGVQQLLVRSDIETRGAHVVIVGRSSLVGRPLANLLSQSGPGADATVTIAHSRTRDLAGICRTADILVVAIGRAEFIRADAVKPGATVIDVGTTRVADATRPRGYRLAGDVAFDEVREVAGAITPVPGGVGPMTIAMLLVNTLQATMQITTEQPLAPARSPQPARMTAFDEAWTVSRLARTLKRRVEDDSSPIWVRGELTGVKHYPSGHWYFCLRDETAKVDCTLWRSAAARLQSPLVEGAEVFAFGTAMVWEERTALRFNVTQVLPAAAIGAQAQSVERIKQALLADGLLDPGRKRPLPEFASRIVGHHVDRRCGGTRYHHRGAPALARRRTAGRQQCGAGRGRVERAGARARDRGPAARHRLLHHRTRRRREG